MDVPPRLSMCTEEFGQNLGWYYATVCSLVYVEKDSTTSSQRRPRLLPCVTRARKGRTDLHPGLTDQVWLLCHTRRGPPAACCPSSSPMNQTMRVLPRGGPYQDTYFERFHKKYLSSMPSRVAMGRFDYSVGSQDKVESYLRAAYPRPPKTPPRPSLLPSFLQTLLQAQDDDGRWEMSDAVVDALGGPDHIPDAPATGVAGWRWTTALVLAFIRQEGPQYLQEPGLLEAYQRAAALVSEEALLAARRALPPRETYFDLDADLVRMGKWQRCLEERMEIKGYQAFVSKKAARDAAALRETSSVVSSESGEAGRAEEATAAGGPSVDGGSHASSSTGASTVMFLRGGIMTRSELLKEQQERERRAAKRRRAAEREAWRQRMLALEYRLLSRAGPEDGGQQQQGVMTAVVPAEGGGRRRRRRDLSHVRRLWEEAIPEEQELGRLQTLQKRIREPPRAPWDGRSPSLEFQTTKRLPLALTTDPSFHSSSASGKPASRPPPPPRRSSPPPPDVAQGKKAEEGGGGGGRRRRRSSAHHHGRAPSTSSVAGEAVAVSRERQSAEHRVVGAILAMEQYVRDVKACLDRCLGSYRRCRLHSERMDVLDEVTAMLGHYRPPQRGFQDWRGRGVKGMHNVICDVVEAVRAWRQVVFEEAHAAAVARAASEGGSDPLRALELQNRAKAMTVQRLPFVYNGENIMLQLPYACEWLAGVPELVAHYGSDMEWRRNPFLRGVTLDERAVTPRKATRSYKLGDEVLEEVVESLLVARRAEEEALRRMQDKLDKAGFWWPGIGADRKHVERVRAAEKEMLEEEALHGARPQLSFFSSASRAAGGGRR